MPAELKYHKDLCEKLPEMFADGSSITQVCATKLDINKDTYYEWKKTYPEFNAAAKKAEAVSQAFWERLGVDGITGNLEKFAGSTWQFVMKNRFKNEYSDQAKVDHTDTLIEKLLEKL